MDLLLVLLCIALFCVLCVVVWQCNHMNYTAKVVLIACSLIVFVIFLKKYAFHVYPTIYAFVKELS